MSGDVLTVVVGLIGVVVSIAASAAAYRYGLQASRDEKEELRGEIIAQREILLSEFAQGLSKLSGVDGRAVGNDGQPVPAGNATAVEIVVKAVLGTLLTATGEVPFDRLLREVSQALGHPSFAEVAGVLEQLREDGVVDWYPPSARLDAVDVIKVRPRPRMAYASGRQE